MDKETARKGAQGGLKSKEEDWAVAHEQEPKKQVPENTAKAAASRAADYIDC